MQLSSSGPSARPAPPCLPSSTVPARQITAARQASRAIMAGRRVRTVPGGSSRGGQPLCTSRPTAARPTSHVSYEMDRTRRGWGAICARCPCSPIVRRSTGRRPQPTTAQTSLPSLLPHADSLLFLPSPALPAICTIPQILVHPARLDGVRPLSQMRRPHCLRLACSRHHHKRRIKAGQGMASLRTRDKGIRIFELLAADQRRPCHSLPASRRYVTRAALRPTSPTCGATRIPSPRLRTRSRYPVQGSAGATPIRSRARSCSSLMACPRLRSRSCRRGPTAR